MRVSTGPLPVFSLGAPPPGTPKVSRRYRVKWRIDGRDKTRAFKTRAEAERLRSRLQVAAAGGEAFDLTTGFPTSWRARPAGPTWWTWWTWSAEWLALKWPRWSGHSRRSVVESLTVLTPLIAQGAPPPGDDLVLWLRHCGYCPGVLTADAVPAWLQDQSVPLHDIDVGSWNGSCTRRRRRRTVTSLRSVGARYAALFAVVGIAGMRPSEAIGLGTVDLQLPKKGWGIAALHGALTSPGTRYTADGEVLESKGLKQRPVDAVRDVPLSPHLVDRLRWHLERWPPLDGRVFSNAGGRPLTTTNYGPVWGRARSQLWPPGHLLATATVYDLRHGAATMMLPAAVPGAEVARRLGHSVDILVRVYAGAFEDERDRSNELIDRALLASENPSRRHEALPGRSPSPTG